MLEKNKHHNKHLQNAYNKYGKENFEFQILLYCDKENLLFYEQRAIDAHNLKKELYNIRIKAESNFGLKASIKTRKLLSEKRKGIALTEEHKKNISKGNVGKKVSKKTKIKLSKINKGKNHPKFGTTHSKETKLKISKSHSGKKCYLYGIKGWENRSSIPIVQIDNGCMWASATEAANKVGGFVFRYATKKEIQKYKKENNIK